MTTTWNPSDKATNVVLSNGNLTATVSASNTGVGRATASKSSGKWYFEFTITAVADIAVGVADATQGIANTDYLGNGAHGIAYQANDNVTYNASTPFVGGTAWIVGDVIGVAFDASAGTVKFYKNNTLKYTATAGNAPSGTLYPAVGGPGAGTTGAGTANFGATTTTYTPPATYSTIDTAPLVDMTTTGGVTVGGAASVSPSSAVVGSGGVSVGGAATVLIHTALLIDLIGSGGLSVGGAASFDFTKASIYKIDSDNEPAGGVLLGGAALVQDVIPFNPTGKAIAGGAAVVQDQIPFTASGRAIAGGAADVSFVSTITAIGSAIAGGSAARSFVSVVSASGGVIAGGAAAVSDRQAFYQATGGAIAGGSAFSYSLPAGFVATAANPYGDPFPGWAVNYETGAPSRYLGLPANSFASLRGVTYVANAAGIYALDAKADAGAPIRARVMLPESDHGSVHNKRIPSVWVAAEMAAAMVMQVVTDNADESYYTVDPTDGGMRASRVEPGKGVEGRFIRVGFANVAGADFTLHSVEMPLSILKRHGR